MNFSKKPVLHLFILQGAYVPLTMEGNIVVEGVLASCYGSFDHDIAHLVMAPMQMFPEITAWIFGEDKPFPFYVKTAVELGEWIIPFQQQKYY